MPARRPAHPVGGTCLSCRGQPCQVGETPSRAFASRTSPLGTAVQPSRVRRGRLPGASERATPDDISPTTDQPERVKRSERPPPPISFSGAHATWEPTPPDPRRAGASSAPLPRRCGTPPLRAAAQRRCGAPALRRCGTPPLRRCGAAAPPAAALRRCGTAPLRRCGAATGGRPPAPAGRAGCRAASSGVRVPRRRGSRSRSPRRSRRPCRAGPPVGRRLPRTSA